jgi:bifunctional UDP-N-acetylglucosamine pyrophosphorylase / glucosamine-1-phosphate N-acetyltransferase
MHNPSKSKAAVILAAGQGTRMKSPLPKVLHKIGHRTMLDRAIDAAEALECERVIIVVGQHSPQVAEAALARVGTQNVVIQDPPLGTAHAVLAAKAALNDFEGQVIISYADCPLMTGAVLKPVFDLSEVADMAVLGFAAVEPGAYGRLIIENDNDLLAIIEAKEASPEELMITTCNSGVLACERSLLFSLLAEVKNDNQKGEYYLTDIVGLSVKRGLKPKTCLASELEVGGVNSQFELSQMEAAWQNTKRRALMDQGVSMYAPETVFFAWDTEVESGVVIEPNIVFAEGVRIASGAVIRAFSHLEGAVIEARAIIGPFARLRPGTVIGEEAHIGNFVEVKNVTFGGGAKANHLSYLGDGEVGPKANIGAGTIFCNYDGFFKARTIIGANAFIGSNTALIAPVCIGEGAMTGSGSVITHDVPKDALALGRGVQVDKLGWAKAFRERRTSDKAKLTASKKG